ncbi:hypothetical protein IJI31_01055 [bacterium]|nr:hypothetical protein [bacterium]
MKEREVKMLSEEDANSLINDKLKEILDSYGKKAYLLTQEILLLSKTLDKEQQSRMIYLSEWNNYHSRPTVSAMRNLINRRNENGFNEVVSKDGKLWMIDEQKYFEWRKNRDADS